MENVVLTIHLILAVLLTGIVLMQRSEGGGLGVGGGSGGVMSGRQAANAMTRLTWILGIALFVTSLSLTVIAARNVSNSSIMDQIGAPQSQQDDSNTSNLPTYTPPPSSEGNPLTPPSPDAAAPAATPEAASETPPATDTAPAAETAPSPETEAVTPPAPAAEEPAAAATPPAENGDAAAGEQPQNPN